MNDLVSIIIPAYNAEKYIQEAIESVFAQTYSGKMEIIIVNDGSTDNTSEKVEELREKAESIENIVDYVNLTKENGGSASARNVGFVASVGEYVQLLDADDILLPEKIQKSYDIMKQNKAIGCVYSKYIQFNSETGEECEVGRPEFSLERQLAECIITTNPMYRACYLDEIGGWNEEFKLVEDYELAVEVSRISEMVYIDEPLFKYRKEGQNKTNEDITTSWDWHKEHYLIKNGLAKNLGAYRKPAINSHCCGGVGDLVAISKAYKFFKEICPEGRVIHYVYPGVFYETIKYNPYIDEIIQTNNLIDGLKDAEKRFAGTKMVILDYFYKYGWNFWKTPLHLAEMFFVDVNNCFVNKKYLNPEFYYNPDGSDFIKPEKMIEKIGSDYVVVESQVRSNKEGKQWEHFDLVYKELDKLGIPIVSLAGNDVEEIAGFKNVINMRGFGIRESARMIEKAKFTVTTQSGLSWIAQAFNKKGIMFNIGAPLGYAGRWGEECFIIDQKEPFSPKSISMEEGMGLFCEYLERLK